MNLQSKLDAIDKEIEKGLKSIATDRLRIRKCVEIYEKSVNYSGHQILKELVFRGDKSKLSEYGRRKLESLEINSKSKVGSIPTYTRKYFNPNPPKTQEKLTLRERIIEKTLLGCAITIIFLFLLGLSVGIQTLWNFIFK